MSLHNRLKNLGQRGKEREEAESQRSHAQPVSSFLGQKPHSNMWHHTFLWSCGTGLWCGGLYPPPLRYEPQSRPRRSPGTHHVALQSPEGTLCARWPVPHGAAQDAAAQPPWTASLGQGLLPRRSPQDRRPGSPHRVSHPAEDASVLLVQDPE